MLQTRLNVKEYKHMNSCNKKVQGVAKKINELFYKTVLFVPPTKGGILLKEMKKREEE